eukprot:EG_transcript_2359
MACLCRRSPKPAGHVLLVNAPHRAGAAAVCAALARHAPVTVLSGATGYLPGVDATPADKEGLGMVRALAGSAMFLAEKGDVAVIDLADPSQGKVAHAAEQLSASPSTPVTAVLLYVSLDQLADEVGGGVTDLLASLQDFGHLFKGSFEPSRDTVDVLTRAAFDRTFHRLGQPLGDDDRISLAIVQRFLGSLLGLDVLDEVHLEPRVNAYDLVLPARTPKPAAAAIAQELRASAASRRLSALHRLAAAHPPAVPACPTCAQHLPEPLAHAPNGRLRSALPVCGPCLSLARRQLLGTNVLARSPCSASQPQDSKAASPHGAVGSRHWHDTLRYNEVFQRSSKNSNARTEGLMDQLVYHRLRSLELDCSAARGALMWAQRAPPRDWWMAHGLVGNVYENHQFDKLSDVLAQLRTFHDAFPKHEVVTLFLNFTDHFGSVPERGHAPEDVDALLRKQLGPDVLFTPQHLKGKAPSLQAAARQGWPSLGALAGKFIAVVVHGATAYADAQDLAERMTCFVAKANVAHTDLIRRHNWVVFFDQGSAADLMPREIEKAGFVSRVWVESQHSYQQAVRKRAHHLATKSLNVHHNAWSKTHTPRGFPFLPFVNGHRGFDSAAAEEPLPAVSLRVSTGDLWGVQDSAVFASFEDHSPDGQWVEYQWLAACANSHMHKWARAGVALRSSRDDDGAAYFALVRPAQYRRPAQVQLRAHADGVTTASAARSVSAVLLKLRCRYTGGSTECEGYYSDDGKKWRLIRSTAIPVRLKFHGLVAASQSEAKNMDGSQYRFVFANLQRDGKLMRKADFPFLTDLGTVHRTARLSDGHDDHADLDLELDLGDADPPEDARLANPDTVPLWRYEG